LFSLPQGGTPFIFNAIDRNKHGHKRRIVGPAFSEKSVQRFEPQLIHQIDIFLQKLLVSGSTPINFTNRAQWLSMDIAGQLGFGFPLELQTREEHRFITKGLTVANWRINAYMNFPFLSKLGFDFLFLRSQLRAQWRSTITKMITTRISQGKQAKPDFYTFVTEKLDNSSEQLQNSELFSESLFFMSAGTWVCFRNSTLLQLSNRVPNESRG
jgi:cytochrome P450